MKGNRTNPRKCPFIVEINLPNLKPIQVKAQNIRELSNLLGIQYNTLRKIIYNENYKSKRYQFALEQINFIRCET